MIRTLIGKANEVVHLMMMYLLSTEGNPLKTGMSPWQPVQCSGHYHDFGCKGTNNGYKKLGPYFFKSDQVKFFFMFLERKECQADRNCAHFYKIKVFRNWRLSKKCRQ